jgi:hypothetical protein
MTKRNRSATKDGWFRRFIHWVWLEPVRIGVVYALVSLAVSGVLAYKYGALFPGPRSQGLLREPGAWFNTFVLSPALVGFYVWIYREGSSLFGELMDGGVLVPDNHSQAVISGVQKWLRNRWLIVLALLLATLFCLYFVVTFGYLQNRTFKSWLTVHPVLVWAGAPSILLVAYCFFMAFFDLIIVVLGLRSLFDGRIVQVQPRHADGAGGLGAIGRFAANLGFIIGLVGLTISANIVTQQSLKFSYVSDYLILLAVIAYVLIAPLVFFLPLQSAHKAMRSFRDNRISEISEEFSKIVSQWSSISKEDPETIQTMVSKVKQLDEMHKIASEFPAWPFSTGSIRKFLSLTTLGPLVPPLISFVVGLAERQLGITR